MPSLMQIAIQYFIDIKHFIYIVCDKKYSEDKT